MYKAEFVEEVLNEKKEDLGLIITEGSNSNNK